MIKVEKYVTKDVEISSRKKKEHQNYTVRIKVI
jgi:hypothetical protein